MKGILVGEITQIGEIEVYGENGFKKRNCILKTVEERPNVYEIEFTGDKVTLLDAVNINENVKINANILGREYTNAEGKYMVFMSCRGWKIEKL